INSAHFVASVVDEDAADQHDPRATPCPAHSFLLNKIE
ncbi:jg556, partial [Pararge aegeria aegeria]